MLCFLFPSCSDGGSDGGRWRQTRITSAPTFIWVPVIVFSLFGYLGSRVLQTEGLFVREENYAETHINDDVMVNKSERLAAIHIFTQRCSLLYLYL